MSWIIDSYLQVWSYGGTTRGLVLGVAWHKRVKRRQTGRTLVALACGSCDMDEELPLCSRLEGVSACVFGGGGKHTVRQRDVTTVRLRSAHTNVREDRVQGDGLATRTCGEAVVGRPRGTIIIGRTAPVIIGALAPVNAIRCRTHTDATWLPCGWRCTTNV